jgi:hypothetical protein
VLLRFAIGGFDGIYNFIRFDARYTSRGTRLINVMVFRPQEVQLPCIYDEVNTVSVELLFCVLGDRFRVLRIADESVIYLDESTYRSELTVLRIWDRDWMTWMETSSRHSFGYCYGL